MSLATDDLKNILAQLDVMCVRAGIAIDTRWQGLMDEAYRCIRDMEESDKRLEWAYPKEGDGDDASL